MYFTAHGRALPCCIAPFSARGYENYTLGDATQQTLRDIWNGPAYQDFRALPARRRAAQALPELRPAVEPLNAGQAPGQVSVVIPTLNEADAIGAVIAEIPARIRRRHHRRRQRQHRRHTGHRPAGRRPGAVDCRSAAMAAPARQAAAADPAATSSFSSTATAPIAAT